MKVGQKDITSLMISTQSQATSLRREANYLPNIDIYWLKKYHYLDRDRKGGFEWHDGLNDTNQLFFISSHVTDYHPHIFVVYKLIDGKDWVVKLTLSRTQCSYDGWRFWFLCPLAKSNGLCCGKRVGVLYKVGDVFGCRDCLKLTYSCRKRNKRYSLFSWFQAITLERRYEKYSKAVKRVKYNHKFTKNYQRMEKTLDKMEGLVKDFPE